MTPLDLSAVALAEAVRVRALSPTDVAEAALQRVEKRNGALNAICAVNPRLDAEAQSIAARLAEGAALPLAGVPVVVKDNIWVRDMPITQGSRCFADFIAPQDAVAVARLRAAGAMILGIGTCSEFACKGVTETPLHGITRNPVDPSLTPGGSSGGPAVAVAARMAPLALGTDAGGSSRRPPAHVGVAGFKPSQDLVPYGPGFEEPVWGISTICPIARSVADLALAMRALSDWPKVAPPPPRIGFAPQFGLPLVLDLDVGQALLELIERLNQAGHAPREIALNWPAQTTGSDVMALQYAGLAALHGARWRSDPDLFDADIGAQIEVGLTMDAVTVAQALQASHRMRVTLRAAFETCDIVICPTTPCAAWPVDRLAPSRIGDAPAGPRDHAAFTPQANHAGVPAISLPFGQTGDGLPLGVQLMAAPGRDAELLHFAAQVEALLAKEVPA